ncbi:Plexin domain-containing protein 2 [Armadillidium vulgare]|nr:Plexin domain-containing protein 2 [Armadillidium vulgare]
MKHFFRILLYIYFLQIIFKPNVHGNKLTGHLENLENQKYNSYFIDDSIVQLHSLEKRDTLANLGNNGNEAASRNISANESVVVHESNTVKIPLVKDEQNATNEVTTEPDSSIYNTDSDSDEQLEPGYNLTKKFDIHKYYKSYYKSGQDDVHHYWVDIDKMPEEKKVSHASLSNAYRRALTVSLKFSFPFYGHILHNVTIATGGFLFTGAYLHKWLAATQYIAPLMANFDTSSSAEATVIYADNGK